MAKSGSGKCDTLTLVLITNHVLAGAVIGRVLAKHPVGAFAAGVVSHFGMDACPHWGSQTEGLSAEFVRVARCDGCAGLTAMAVAAGLSPGHARRSVVAGMMGAAVVDIDKPMNYFFGWNPVPQRLQDFHVRIQNETPQRMPLELAIGDGLAVVALRVLRWRR